MELPTVKRVHRRFRRSVFEIETIKSLKQIWLFSKVEYYTGEGVFGVKINPDARQYFLN